MMIERKMENEKTVGEVISKLERLEKMWNKHLRIKLYSDESGVVGDFFGNEYFEFHNISQFDSMYEKHRSSFTRYNSKNLNSEDKKN